MCGLVDAVALIVQIHLLQNRNDLALKEVAAARRWAQDSLLVNLAESWVGLRLVHVIPHRHNHSPSPPPSNSFTFYRAAKSTNRHSTSSRNSHSQPQQNRCAHSSARPSPSFISAGSTRLRRRCARLLLKNPPAPTLLPICSF